MAHVFLRSFSSQASSRPVSTSVLGRTPARVQRAWNRAFGWAPPPKNTGYSSRGSAGRILWRWAWTARFIGRQNALCVFTRR
jgi:hypothetical protein